MVCKVENIKFKRKIFKLIYIPGILLKIFNKIPKQLINVSEKEWCEYRY